MSTPVEHWDDGHNIDTLKLAICPVLFYIPSCFVSTVGVGLACCACVLMRLLRCLTQIGAEEEIEQRAIVEERDWWSSFAAALQAEGYLEDEDEIPGDAQVCGSCVAVLHVGPFLEGQRVREGGDVRMCRVPVFSMTVPNSQGILFVIYNRLCRTWQPERRLPSCEQFKNEML